MDLFGGLLDLSLENNAFPTALMDLFQKNSSRLIKLIVTACPNLSWHYGMSNKKSIHDGLPPNVCHPQFSSTQVHKCREQFSLNAHNSSLKKCIVHEMAKKKGNNSNGVVTKKL